MNTYLRFLIFDDKISDNLMHIPNSFTQIIPHKTFQVASSLTRLEPPKTGILYLSTTPSPTSKSTLERALAQLLPAIPGSPDASPLYAFYYEQAQGAPAPAADGPTLTVPAPRTSLAFDDAAVESVREAWEWLGERLGKGEGEESGFMVFEDREGVDDDEM
jgi:hypothetical protein